MKYICIYRTTSTPTYLVVELELLELLEVMVDMGVEEEEVVVIKMHCSPKIFRFYNLKEKVYKLTKRANAKTMTCFFSWRLNIIN